MTDNNFNFNFSIKGLGKTGVLLIEKISNACGMVYADLVHKGQYPHDRVRAGGNEQSVLNSSDISDSSKRALAWDMANKVREYKNISEILSQAAIQLSPQASEEKIDQIDDDWIAYVMKQAAMVSDTAMQDVWAKIISNEAENPGKFSRRAVDIISVMSKKDADLFTKIGQFVTDATPSSKRELLIYSAFDDVYTKQGVDYNAILHFQSLGLIHYWENSHSLYHKQPKAIFCYRNFSIEVSLPLTNDGRRYEFEAGEVSLTFAGREVLSLAERKVNPEFWGYIIERWKKLGIIPSA